MTERFLKAKHWQLFLLTFGIPMIFQFIMIGTMISNIGSETNTDPTSIFNYLKLFPLVMIIFMSIFWMVLVCCSWTSKKSS